MASKGVPLFGYENAEISVGVVASLSVIATTLFSLSLWKFFVGKLKTIRRTSLSSVARHTDTTDAVTELRNLRESGIRDSSRVVQLWHEAIPQLKKLGIEKWAIVEQVFIASLDIADDKLAQECLGQLRSKFKKSARVNRLFAMYLECNNRFDDTRAIYTQLLNDDPTNTLARKRMIAILKSQRKTCEAIEELRLYLKTFMSDFEAWNELADLYLLEGDYKHAAFCMEELLLSNPHNHLYCQRYAEIKYTEGGNENLELARTYYARACQLNPDSLRNLYGLLLTCSALHSQSATSKASWDPITVLRLTDRINACDPTKLKLCDGSPISNAKSVPVSSPTNSVWPGLGTGGQINRDLIRWATQKIQAVYEASVTSQYECSRAKQQHSPCSPSSKSILDRQLTQPTASLPIQSSNQ